MKCSCNIKKDGIRYGLYVSIIVCVIFNIIRDKVDFLRCQKDIIYFFTLMIISFIIFTLVNILFDVSKLKINTKVNNVLDAILIIVAFAWLFLALKNESTHFPGVAILYFRHLVNGKLYFFLLLTFIFLIYIVLKNVSLNSRKKILLIYVMAILMSILLFTPNPFLDGFGGIYHIHAYENSIYNVLQGQPYYLENTSIYGHYGLFFYLPVKLLNIFGVDIVVAINITVVLAGTISFICVSPQL